MLSKILKLFIVLALTVISSEALAVDSDLGRLMNLLDQMFKVQNQIEKTKNKDELKLLELRLETIMDEVALVHHRTTQDKLKSPLQEDPGPADNEIQKRLMKNIDQLAQLGVQISKAKPGKQSRALFNQHQKLMVKISSDLNLLKGKGFYKKVQTVEMPQVLPEGPVYLKPEVLDENMDTQPATKKNYDKMKAQQEGKGSGSSEKSAKKTSKDPRDPENQLKQPEGLGNTKEGSPGTK